MKLDARLPAPVFGALLGALTGVAVTCVVLALLSRIFRRRMAA